MAPPRGKSIPALFQASKRLRVDAGTPMGPVELSTAAALSAHEDGEKLSKAGAKASNAFDLHPLPGFEPPPARLVDPVDAQQGNVPESTAQEGDDRASGPEKAPELSIVQRMRMELNKTVARAKRNSKTCEERISESLKLGRSFPEFQDLLVEQSWLDVLQGEFAKQYMTKLHTFVQQEAAGRLPIYPPPALVFNAFNTCPFDKVKVVIIGQDPYHGPGQAMGLSFSVPHGTKIPSSLVNIFREIRDDVGSTIPSHGNLEKWAHQGVLMLNAVLTVREHHANSHAKKGWEPFTDAAIRAVSHQKQGVIFLLWGNSAFDKTRLIDTTQHHILKAAHPSGLSAHKGFFNCRHFSKTNQLLEKAGELPVDWQL